MKSPVAGGEPNNVARDRIAGNLVASDFTIMAKHGFIKYTVFYMAFFALILLATGLLWGLLEMFLSRTVERPGDIIHNHFRLNHVWPPGIARVHDEFARENPEWPEPYTHYYNQQGWLETYDVSKQKPAGTYRIFYVGDSFTEGCVPMDQSVASQLEIELNRRFQDSGRKYEVINTGTSSYSPLIYYILIRYIILEYEPDVVVMNLDMTDSFDDWKYRQTAIFDPQGNPYAAPARDIYDDIYVQTRDGVRKATFMTRLNLWLFQNSYVYNYFTQEANLKRILSVALQNKDQPARPIPQEGEIFSVRSWVQHTWSEKTEKNVAFTMDLVARSIRFMHANGIKPVITVVPRHQQFDPVGDGTRTRWSLRPHREFERVAREEGAVFIDSHGSLKDKIHGTPWERYYYRDDMHFNPDGNDLWADAHIEAFLDPGNDLLP